MAAWRSRFMLRLSRQAPAYKKLHPLLRSLMCHGRVVKKFNLSIQISIESTQ